MKSKNKISSEDDHRQGSRRHIWMRLAAVLLIIVFLASECATLLSME